MELALGLLLLAAPCDPLDPAPTPECVLIDPVPAPVPDPIAELPLEEPMPDVVSEALLVEPLPRSEPWLDPVPRMRDCPPGDSVRRMRHWANSSEKRW